MKLPLYGIVLALAAWRLTQASRLRAKAEMEAKATVGVGLRASMGSMVSDMLERKKGDAHSIAHKIHKRMKFEEALPQIEGKLPKDVVSLVNMATASKSKAHAGSKGVFSEESLSKARVFLNEMMLDALVSVDKITVGCKEFEESNRAVYGQIRADIADIGATRNLAQSKKAEAIEGQGEMRDLITEAFQTRRRLKWEYMKTRGANARELSLRQDDQDVFTAILQLTQCPDGANDYSFSQWKVCETEQGTEEVVADDPSLQEKLQKSPRAQKALLMMLGGNSSKSADAAAAVSQLQQAPTTGGKYGRRACRMSKTVNCGELHDTMAMEWGKFKDLVDELTAVMEHDHDEWVKKKENLNEQVSMLRNRKSMFAEMIAGTSSDLSSLGAESKLKYEERRDTQKAYWTKMRECRDQITEILYTGFCAVRVVRNTLLKYSATQKPSMLADCSVTDWSPGPCTVDGRSESASVDCDDNCPDDVGGVDVDACGGIAQLTRQVIVSPNSLGMACPPLVFEPKNGTAGMKCNQFHCPKPCVLSEWSGWSECSTECGGGSQEKTRSVLERAKNGGQACSSTFEAQPCNTGSCTRDCTLSPWSDWEPCSQACDGGMQKRIKKVDIPIRGSGKCPGEEHPDRMQWRQCNTQECAGDEICIAKQDLIIALDASGSLKEEGFKIVQEFTHNLTGRYQSIYFGAEDMNIGLVLFGNGVYYTNGTVSAALEVVPLTSDIEQVRTGIKGTVWQKGFTNMMQALEAADHMLLDGRDDAQSAIMVISDGKYTNAYRTGMKAQELKDKGTQIYMLPITNGHSKLQELKTWASEPWETNYVQLPAPELLSANEAEFAERILVKFCPRAYSPSRELARETQAGYLKIHEDGYPADSCGAWQYMGRARSVEACMEKVRQRFSGTVLAFSYEEGGWWPGACYSEAITVDDTLWTNAMADRVNILCGGASDAWVFNYYASTYIMNPSMFGNVFGT